MDDEGHDEMTERVNDTPRGLGEILTALAGLTPAQHTLLGRISEHSSPVTVTELAEESGLHVSSVRETMDGLYSLGLVVREQLPAHGRGRPALGYVTHTPSDPSLPAQLLTQAVTAVLAWLRANVPDPQEAALGVGREWGDIALSMLHVPDHSKHRVPPEGFRLANHMAKIRLFLTHLGLAATPHPARETALVLSACPFTDADAPDPLAFFVRRGIVERVLERTSAGSADIEVLPDPDDPMRAVVVLTERPTARRQTVTTIRYYGGAAEAAGVESETLTPRETPATLDALIETLSARTPALAPVLAACSFLVDQTPAGPGTALDAGSTVDVLPPFAGG